MGYGPFSDSTLIACLVTAGRFERELIIAELERRAKAAKEGAK